MKCNFSNHIVFVLAAFELALLGNKINLTDNILSNTIYTNLTNKHFLHDTATIIIILVLIMILVIFLLVFHNVQRKNQNKINTYKDLLENNRQEIKNIYSHFSDIYIKTDLKGKIVEVSPSVLNITGYKASYYTNKHISKAFAYKDEWVDVAESIFKNEIVQDRLYSAKTKFNKPIICSVSIKVYKDKNGKIRGYDGILKDFSQRISTQAKIEDVETSLTESLNFSDTGISKFKTNSNLFSSDSLFNDLLGFSSQIKNWKTSHFFELIHEKERENVLNEFNKLLNKKKSSFVINCRFKNVDNRYLWFSNKFEIIKQDNTDRAVEIIGIHTLIEYQKKLETNILDYKRKLNSLYNSTKVMLFVIKEDFSILEINDTVSERLDLPRTKIIGKSMNDVFYTSTSKTFTNKLNTLIKNSFDNKINSTKQEIVCTQSKNKKYFNVSTNIYIGGKNQKCIITIEETTKQKTYELQTQKRLNILEKKEKETLSSINKIANEIRSPINEIVSASSNNSLSIFEKDKAFNSNIENNVRQILDLIDDLDNLAKTKTKTLNLYTEKINVIDFFDSLSESLKSDTVANNIKIAFNSNRVENNVEITADREKLKSVLTTTISTLTTLIESKSIEIEASYTNQSHIIKIIADTKNIEFSLDNLKNKLTTDIIKIIDAKFFVEQNESDQVICKFIIKEKYTKPEKDFIARESMQQSKILIVEDEEYNIYYLQQILSLAGYKTVVAEDGQKAIDAVSQDVEIDLILMDIRLPGIDGIEASKRIKGTNPNMPIIAQTAFNLNSEEDQNMEKYCDDYIQKPIISQDLYQKIENILKLK